MRLILSLGTTIPSLIMVSGGVVCVWTRSSKKVLALLSVWRSGSGLRHRSEPLYKVHSGLGSTLIDETIGFFVFDNNLDLTTNCDEVASGRYY